MPTGNDTMTKQEFHGLYSKSIYQVRLEVITHMWTAGKYSMKECIDSADTLVLSLLKEEDEELKDKFSS